MKFIVDTTNKEVHIPDNVKLLELLELATILNSDTEDYIVTFYEEELDLSDANEDASLSAYMKKYFDVDLNWDANMT